MKPQIFIEPYIDTDGNLTYIAKSAISVEIHLGETNYRDIVYQQAEQLIALLEKINIHRR